MALEYSFIESEDAMEYSIPSENASALKKREQKIKEKWTSQQKEKLIEEVQIREGLWNFLTKEYKDRNLRETLWQEVANEMQMPRAEVSAQWNSIRCSFRVSLNKLRSTKSGQAAGKVTAMNPLHKSLQFLEPNLRIEAPTTSNLCKKPDSLSEEEDVEQSTSPTFAASSKRSCQEKNDDKYSEAVDRALKTLDTVSNTDLWDDIGNFVSSNGREWATSNPKLANDFKSTVYKVVYDFQMKATEAVDF